MRRSCRAQGYRSFGHCSARCSRSKCCAKILRFDFHAGTDFRMQAATDRLTEYIERNIERTLADCTTCGKCFDACPMTAYGKTLEGKSGAEVVGGIRTLLSGEGGTPE